MQFLTCANVTYDRNMLHMNDILYFSDMIGLNHIEIPRSHKLLGGGRHARQVLLLHKLAENPGMHLVHI